MKDKEKRIAEARAQMPDRYLCMTEVTALVGLKPSTIYSLIKRNEFLSPVRIGRKSVRWSERELRSWLDSKTDDTK